MRNCKESGVPVMSKRCFVVCLDPKSKRSIAGLKSLPLILKKAAPKDVIDGLYNKGGPIF